MVEMIEPYKGRVYDPACGSGGMFVMSEKFITEHQGNISDITVYGQESNQTTWKLSKMNLAIRNINSQFVSWNTEGSFLKDAHPDLKADFILANGALDFYGRTVNIASRLESLSESGSLLVSEYVACQPKVEALLKQLSTRVVADVVKLKGMSSELQVRRVHF